MLSLILESLFHKTRFDLSSILHCRIPTIDVALTFHGVCRIGTETLSLFHFNTAEGLIIGNPRLSIKNGHDDLLCSSNNSNGELPHHKSKES